MRIFVVFLLMIAALAGGYLLGSWHAGERGRGSAGTPPPAAAREPAPGPQTPVSEGEAPKPEEPATPDEPEREAPEASEPPPPEEPPDLADALAALPEAAPLSGTAKLSGRVVTRAGEAVPGARVVAWIETPEPAPDKALLPLHDLESSVRRLVARWREQQASTAEDVTDDEGRFELVELAPRVYTVFVDAPGIRLEAGKLLWNAGAQEDGRLDLIVKPVSLMPLRVTADGNPVTAALIHVQRHDRVEFRDWSPENDTLELETGRYRIRALAGPQYELVSAFHIITTDTTKPAEALELKLSEPPGIRGQVIFAEDDPQREVMVYAVSKSAADRIREPAELSDAAVAEMSVDRVTGTGFVLAELLSGTYLLGAGPRGMPPLATAVVEVEDGLTVQNLELAASQPGDWIRVQVLGPDEQQISDAEVEVGGLPVGRAADGAFRVRRPVAVPGDGRDETRTELHARSDTFGSKRLEIDPGTPADVVLRFEPAAVLVVQLLGHEAHPLRRSLAGSIVPEVGTSENLQAEPIPYRTTIDAAGRFELGPAPPGPYELVVTGQRRSGELALIRTDVTLVPGRVEITLPLPELYDLTVIATGYAAGDRFELEPAELQDRITDRMARREARLRSRILTATVDATGQVVFEQILAGTYVLTDPRGIPTQLEIPAQAFVAVERKPIYALLVRVDDPQGALAAVGFRDGDRIVGFEERPFLGEAESRAQIQAMAQRSEARLVVRRGRGMLDFVIDPRVLFEPEGRGGSWTMVFE